MSETSPPSHTGLRWFNCVVRAEDKDGKSCSYLLQYLCLDYAEALKRADAFISSTGATIRSCDIELSKDQTASGQDQQTVVKPPEKPKVTLDAMRIIDSFVRVEAAPKIELYVQPNKEASTDDRAT